MENMLETFRRGEVVWAKLTGYPWWPGAVKYTFTQVVEVKQNSKDRMASTCIVKFFGEDSQYIFILQFSVAYSLFQKSLIIPIATPSTPKRALLARN